jgi:fructokinase
MTPCFDFQIFAERQVNVNYIQRVDKPTRDVLVTRTMDGDREFAGFRSDTSAYADCFLDAEAIPSDLIENCSVCVTGTLGLAYPGSREAIEKVTALASSSAGCTLIIDVNWRPVFWKDVIAAREIVSKFVNSADLIKITDEEAEWLLGMSPEKALGDPEAVLLAFPSAKGVLVSAGEKGSSYAFHSKSKMNYTGTVPVLSVDIADTTGAGDAYLAGFVHFMLASGGLDALQSDATLLQKSIEFATACGASTCTKPGAIDAQPTVEDIQKLLRAFS